MTVNPGWGGQAFLPGSLAKLERLRALVGTGPALEVDGGIDAATAGPCARAGATVFVAGSAVFGAATRARRTARWRPPHASECGQPYGRRICLRHNRSQTWVTRSSSSTITPRFARARGSCSSPRGSTWSARPGTARRRSTRAAGCTPRSSCSTSSCPTSTASTSGQQLTAHAEHPTVIMVSSRDGSDFGPLVTHSGACGFVPKAELSGERVQELLWARDRPAARARARRDRGLVVGLVALALVLSSDHVDQARRRRSRSGCSSAGRSSASGCYAWWRRPDNRFGVLMARSASSTSSAR